MGLQNYVEVEEPEEEELEILAAEKELAELDDQFSGVSLDAEDMGDAMQIRDGDDDAMDLDADSEEDVSLDDEALDDALGLSDELGADFDDEE